MASKGNMKGLEDLVYDIFKFIGFLLSCFFEGFRELRKKIPSIVFMTAAAVVGVMFILVRFFDIGDNDYVIYSAALPASVLFVLGAMRKQKQAYYERLFMDAGFKGKDGRTPRFISNKNEGKKTLICFKSNIPLSTWEKNKEVLQTAFDFKILSTEQGKSKKVVILETVPASDNLSNFEPWKPEYLSKVVSEIVLGISNYGQLKFDFNDIAHWIIAGAPGVGKSVLVRLIAYQCFLKGFKVYIMDFKRGMEFGKIYDHFCKVIMDKESAAELLTKLEKDCQNNSDIIRESGLKNIDEYNKAFPDNPMQRNVIIIDELAILLMAGRDKEDKENTAIATRCLEQIAILGRAPGFNLVLGIQRPDANTVTGQIKTNVSGRISGYFSDVAPSQIVLNNSKATELPPPSKAKGRYMYSYGQETIEFQGYYLDDFKAMKKLLDEREQQHPEPPEPAPSISPTQAPAKPTRAAAASTHTQKRGKLELVTNYDDC